MKKYIKLVCLFFLITILIVACNNEKINKEKVTSLAFVPIGSPFEDIGEFTINKKEAPDKFDIILNIIEKALSNDKLENENIPLAKNGFSINLFQDEKNLAIYRIYFDLDNDLGFLQDEDKVYGIIRDDFHNLIETGYFNVLFKKNYAPEVNIELMQEIINYSVNGSWEYETYPDYYVAYKVQKPNPSKSICEITDKNTNILFSFEDKEPDSITLTLMSSDKTIYDRILLSNNQIPIPNINDTLYYELEASWKDKNKPYRGNIKYNFTIKTNYPQEIIMKDHALPGDLFVIYFKYLKDPDKVLIASDFYTKDPINIYPYKDFHVAFIPLMSTSKIGNYKVSISNKDEPESIIFEKVIRVEKKEFPIQRIYPPKSKVSLRTDDNYKILKETLDEAREYSQPDKLWDDKFIMPVTGRISTEYGVIRYINGRLASSRHNAIDIAAPKGTPVLAPANGVVTYVGDLAVTGKTIVIDHGMGIFSQYYHLDEFNVVKGEQVLKERQIASVGNTGFSTGPHLDFSIYNNGVNINPWPFFDEDILSSDLD